jgi:hypothetical protein
VIPNHDFQQAIIDPLIEVDPAYTNWFEINMTTPDNSTWIPMSRTLWEQYRIPEPRPALNISGDKLTLTLTWPLAFSTWTLEQTDTLALTNWTAIAPPLSTNGSNLTFTTNCGAAQRFFRLRKPRAKRGPQHHSRIGLSRQTRPKGCHS